MPCRESRMGNQKDPEVNPTTVEFHRGDVVRLKSGGPQMTVESVVQFVACVWFDEKELKRRNDFLPETLEKVTT
jgi:uncharacterized protein YodC (DUF2158 family)